MWYHALRLALEDPMLIYRVTVADRENGQERVLDVEAATPEEAEQAAIAAGWLVATVEEKAPPAPPLPTLPRTGLDAITWALYGLGLVLIGSTLVDHRTRWVGRLLSIGHHGDRGYRKHR